MANGGSFAGGPAIGLTSATLTSSIKLDFLLAVLLSQMANGGTGMSAREKSFFSHKAALFFFFLRSHSFGIAVSYDFVVIKS